MGTLKELNRLAGGRLRFSAKAFRLNKNLSAVQREVTEWKPNCMEQLYFYSFYFSLRCQMKTTADLEDHESISTADFPGFIESST